jgi:F-type H+-transporting ATPase subunit gamma
MPALSLRDLRKRIRSSQKTQQITKTMQMVAASRLKRSEEKFRQAKPYAEKMGEILAHLAQAIQSMGGEFQHPFFERREVRNTALVVITSDRGLCGAYNTNIISQAEAFLAKRDPRSVKLFLIGKKGYDYFRKRDWEILDKSVDMAGKPDFRRISEVTQRIIDAYLSRTVDEVHLLYSSYLSALSIRPVTQKFLNLEPEAGSGAVPYIVEPSLSDVLSGFLPLYVNSKMFITLLEAFTAENSARMVAMKTATDNAAEIIDRLTLLRNKARQAAITKEILEIVTAGEALKG